MAKSRHVLPALLLAGSALAAGPSVVPDPKGDWMVADRTAVIRIAACGET